MTVKSSRVAAPLPTIPPGPGTTDDPPRRSTRWSIGAWVVDHRSEAALVAVLLVIAVIATSQSSVFLTAENWRTVLLQGSFVGILACGTTLLMVSGLIDLSVGAGVSFAGMVFGTLLVNSGVPLGLALVAAVLVATLVGVFNGVLAANSVAHPFILTLGTMTLLQGAALTIGTQPIIGFPSGLLDVVGSQPGGIPFVFIVFAVIAVICHVLLSRTVVGRHMYAIGGSRGAARLAGVRVRRMMVCLYAFMGVLVGITAILMTATFSSAGPQAGNGMELTAIAAVAVGGTPLEGGRGGIPGTVLGVLLIVMIGNVLNLLSINSNLQYVLVGAIIIIAVMAQGRAKSS